MEDDDDGQSLLQLAALSGNEKVVKAVWRACRNLGLQAKEVWSILLLVFRLARQSSSTKLHGNLLLAYSLLSTLSILWLYCTEN